MEGVNESRPSFSLGWERRGRKSKGAIEMDETRRRSSLVVLVVPVSSLQVRLAQNLPASQCGLGGTWGGPGPASLGVYQSSLSSALHLTPNPRRTRTKPSNNAAGGSVAVPAQNEAISFFSFASARP